LSYDRLKLGKCRPTIGYLFLFKIKKENVFVVHRNPLTFFNIFRLIYKYFLSDKVKAFLFKESDMGRQ